jgi:hypothetical protein
MRSDAFDQIETNRRVGKPASSMKTRFLTITSLLAAMTAHAVIVSAKIDVLNDEDTLIRDSSGVPLWAGDPQFSNDGTAMQVGYYDQGTVANPFLGKWIALTGEESSNGYFFTIGDTPGAGLADGRIETSFFLQEQTIHGFDFPPSTSIPLAIRFYNNFSVFASQNFNTVSNTSGEWNWKNENQALIGLIIWDAANPALAWEGGPGSAYRTTIPIGVPEPSALLLATVSTFVALARPARVRP